MKNGIMIAAMGIPASGKSTTMEELSKLIPDSVLYLEAIDEGKEIVWPKAVTMRDKYGYFGSLSWFRSLRVPKLYNAEEMKNSGKIAILDSYYDKLIHLYLGSKGLDWFFPREDPYYKVAKEMSKLDYETLPLADIIVFFWVTEDIWKLFYNSRNRDMDQEELFRKQCMDLQEPMLKACKTYVNEHNKRLIIVYQSGKSAENVAKDIYAQIKGIIV